MTMYLVCVSGVFSCLVTVNVTPTTLKTTSWSLWFCQVLRLFWLSSARTYERQSLVDCWRCSWLVLRGRAKRPFLRLYSPAGRLPSPPTNAASPLPCLSWKNLMVAKTTWEKQLRSMCILGGYKGLSYLSKLSLSIWNYKNKIYCQI